MRNRYIVVCQARTGSTMLSSALQQHPDVCGHGEVLNMRDDDRLEFVGLDYKSPGALHDYLRAVRNRSPVVYLDRYVFHAGRHKISGFKFKYEELSHPCFQSAREYVLRNKDIKVIHMTRDNIWKRFLSEYVALHVTKTFNSSDKSIVVPETTVRIEPEEIEASFRRTLAWQSQYMEAFSEHENIHVTYEQFSKDPNAAFAHVTDFLEIEGRVFEPHTKKIKQSKKQEDFVENYADIASYFRTSEFAPFFAGSEAPAG